MHIHAEGYWFQSTGLSYTLLYLKQFKKFVLIFYVLKIMGFKYASHSFNKAHVYEYMQVLSLGE